jgi:hypothetical protein
MMATNEEALIDFVFKAESFLDPFNSIPDLKGSAILVPILKEVQRY